MRHTLLSSLFLAAAISLAGCDVPAAPEAAEQDEAGHTDRVHAGKGDGGAERDGGETPDRIPGIEPLPELAEDAEETESTRAIIPANYHGVWDYEGGTCSPESDLRMDISGREVLFYESVGTVQAVAKDGEDTIVTLDMEGEGETWVQAIRLSLEGAGGEPDAIRLHTSDGEKAKTQDEYPSKKCPE